MKMNNDENKYFAKIIEKYFFFNAIGVKFENIGQIEDNKYKIVFTVPEKIVGNKSSDIGEDVAKEVKNDFTKGYACMTFEKDDPSEEEIKDIEQYIDFVYSIRKDEIFNIYIQGEKVFKNIKKDQIDNLKNFKKVE